MGIFSTLNWPEGVIPSAVFLLVLWALPVPKYSPRVTRAAWAGLLAASLAVQGTILALGGEPELVLTLLPLTLCLPSILAAHLLSKSRFIPTAAAWLLALLCYELLRTLHKLFLSTSFRYSQEWKWFSSCLLLLAAAALVVLVYRFLRIPFHACAQEMEVVWPPLLFLPVMLLALYSYLLASPASVPALVLLFFTALASLLVLARLIISLAEQSQAKESRRQMDSLQQSCELMREKLELGRSYRHDMRHHMAALSALLQQKDCAAALRYLSEWQGQLTQIETEAWCRNAAVDAVLSTYLTRAKEDGCALEVDISLPEQLPVQEIDLCVVLANALENAIQACKELPEGTPRYIRLSAVLTGGRRLAISVDNPAPRAIEFDGQGFPVSPHREGHGQGLKSIAAVAEKYHGLFQCCQTQGTFALRVALLSAVPAPRRRSWIPGVCTAIFLCLFLLNCMPTLTQALEDIPLLGQAVRVVDMRSYSWLWGDIGISIQEPVLEGDSQAVEAIEAEKDAFIRQMEETFLTYAARKYQGYVVGDADYQVIRDDEELFILRFCATINAGGSFDCYHHVVLSQESGQILSLADLFQNGANYIFPISREIKAQMAERMNAGEGDYFLPGGIWPEEECFQSIDPDQDFYINNEDQLVIVFAEYEVAPGSMGVPEFVIPADCLDGILVQPSILK